EADSVETFLGRRPAEHIQNLVRRILHVRLAPIGRPQRAALRLFHPPRAHRAPILKRVPTRLTFSVSRTLRRARGLRCL
ncbi:hypothetical protein BE221DRAFT_90258, partial [Ostreococcus tauri]